MRFVFLFLSTVVFGELPEIPQVKLTAKQTACKVVDDCVHVMTACTGNCGNFVNKKYETQINQERSKICKNYNGIMMKILCRPKDIKCLKGQCVAEDMPPKN